MTMTYPATPCGHRSPCVPAECVRPLSHLGPYVEEIEVPEHRARRLTLKNPDGTWVLTQTRTGCIRVQRGDFTAYFDRAFLVDLEVFIRDQRHQNQRRDP